MRTHTNDAGTRLDLVGTDFSFPLRETAHEQLAERVGIPKAYYDRLREHSPELFDRNVNHRLLQATERRLVRTLDGAVRTIPSDRYRPLDNHDLADVALPVLAEHGFEVKSAGRLSEEPRKSRRKSLQKPELRRQEAVFAQPLFWQQLTTKTKPFSDSLRDHRATFLPEGRHRPDPDGGQAG